MDADSIADQLVESADKSELHDYPFAHFRMKNCFAPDVYTSMTDNFPDPSLYRQLLHRDARLGDGTSSRSLFELTESNVRLLPDRKKIWAEVMRATTTTKVKNAIFTKVADTLSKRFRLDVSSAKQIVGTPRPALCRDIEGYEIRPHCDTPRKIVTTQFYFPSDVTQEHLGTSLYQQENGSFRCIETLPYIPNTAYGFVPTNQSWHGREKLDKNARERHSLLLIYFDGASGYFKK